MNKIAIIFADLFGMAGSVSYEEIQNSYLDHYIIMRGRNAEGIGYYKKAIWNLIQTEQVQDLTEIQIMAHGDPSDAKNIYGNNKKECFSLEIITWLLTELIRYAVFPNIAITLDVCHSADCLQVNPRGFVNNMKLSFASQLQIALASNFPRKEITVAGYSGRSVQSTSRTYTIGLGFGDTITQYCKEEWASLDVFEDLCAFTSSLILGANYDHQYRTLVSLWVTRIINRKEPHDAEITFFRSFLKLLHTPLRHAKISESVQALIRDNVTLDVSPNGLYLGMDIGENYSIAFLPEGYNKMFFP